MKRYFNCFIVFFALILLTGCAQVTVSQPSDLHAAVKTGGEDQPAETKTEPDYVIQVGDSLDIKFFYDPELNERVTIRPDGKISLQIIDEVKAIGLTPAELRKTLSEKYSRILLQPEIAVIVREMANQKVYVGGEVTSPRVVALTGEMTALQAILNAGGFKETAHTGSVIIVSKGPNNTPVVRRVDLSDVISGEAPEKDILLRPFDIVYVPKTFIAQVNKFVEQYIKNVIPGNLTGSFGYMYYSGHQTGTLQTIPAQP